MTSILHAIIRFHLDVLNTFLSSFATIFLEIYKYSLRSGKVNHFFSELKMFPNFLDILEEESRDWVGIRSLTGANASGWKFQDSFYGNFNSGRQPAMDTAWGRRVYDQYEIEFEVDKPKHSYLTEPPNSGMVKFGYKTEHVERQKLRKTLGNHGIFYL